jgi:hypothetical protein
MATRAGRSDVVEVLCTAADTAAAAATAAATAAAAAAAADADATGSVARGTVKGGCTLMHAAAASRSLRCAEVLLRHGVDAAAVTDTVPGKDYMSGLSALDLLVVESPYRKILPHVPVLQGSPAEFEQFALLLLSCGATIKYTAMSAEHHYMFARVLHKHTVRQQQQLRKTVQLATLQVAARWYECDDGANSCSSGSSSSDRSNSNTVRVQLVHAVTKQRNKRVYMVNTQLLSQLYSYTAAGALSTTASASSSTSSSSAAAIATEQHSSSSSSSSSSGDNKVDSSGSAAMQAAARQNVLVKMLVPPEGWQSCTSTNELKLISYDGKCTCYTVLTLYRTSYWLATSHIGFTCYRSCVATTTL